MRHKAKPYDQLGITILERMRRFNHLTLADIKERTGISRSSLGRMMQGHFPDVRVAIRVARLFQVSVEDIWGDQAK